MTARVPLLTASRPASPATRLPLFSLLAANGISLVGSMLSLIAIPWFVLATSGSAARVGLTAAAQALATVVAAFGGGALVDRLGHKRASVVADCCSAVTVAAIPALYLTVGLPFAGLLALVFLRSFFDTPGNTARQALIPDLAESAGWSLERANSAVQAVQRGARLIGAPVAGLLIGLFAPANVLWLDAASFLISAGLVLALVATRATAAATEREPYFSAIRAGLAFIWRDPLLRAIVLTVALTNFLESPIFGVMLPVFAKRTYGSAAALGWMVAAVGGGALLGALAYGALSRRLPRRATFLLAFLVLGLPYWVLSLLPSLPVSVLVMLAVGIAAGPINPIIYTVLQERIPTSLRGRVFGTTTAVAMIATPAGLSLGGYVLAWLGLRPMLIALSTAFLLVSLALFLIPAFRRLNDPAAALVEA